MRKTVFIILSLFLSGCVANTAYTVTPAEYAQQVKALGVLPVLIDAESIDYAARDELFSLLELSTAAVQQTLVDKLRKQGRHFDVRPVTGDPESIRTRILAGQSTVGETASTHLKYTFSSEGSAALADEAVADALLVVVVHGIKRQENVGALSVCRWIIYGAITVHCFILPQLSIRPGGFSGNSIWNRVKCCCRLITPILPKRTGTTPIQCGSSRSPSPVCSGP